MFSGPSSAVPVSLLARITSSVPRMPSQEFLLNIPFLLLVLQCSQFVMAAFFNPSKNGRTVYRLVEVRELRRTKILGVFEDTNQRTSQV